MIAIAVHFLLVPCVILVLSRRLFRWMNVGVEDELVLSQRFNRACVAVTFVYGGASSLLQISREVSNITLGTAHASADYWLAGTVVFYVFDCLLLAWYRQFNASMWIHHFLAISLFSAAVWTGQGQVGCLIALLAEALVPWGFLLFFFRARQLTASFWFQVVCCGGMLTLTLRMVQWICVLYVHNFVSWNTLPLLFRWFVNCALIGGLGLDVTWFQLYWSNFQRSGQGLGKRTASMNKIGE